MLGAGVLLALGACASTSSREIIGRARAPRPASEVQVLFEPPRSPYELIAVLRASSRHSFAWSSHAKEDAVLERLRHAAAEVGADAVLMQELGDQPLAELGGAVGAEREGPRGVFDLGLGGTLFRSSKFGRGLAISLQSSSPAIAAP